MSMQLLIKYLIKLINKLNTQIKPISILLNIHLKHFLYYNKLLKRLGKLLALSKFKTYKCVLVF